MIRRLLNQRPADRDPALRLVKQQVEQRIAHQFGAKVIEFDLDEAIVLCVVRNGEPWIGDFIEHYQAKGFRHVVLLDTGSRDTTLEIARRFPGVTALTTDLPFQSYGLLLRQYLVERFGRGRWSLTVDVDELWDYPQSGQIPLQRLLRSLRSEGANAVVAHMLDLFSERLPSRPKPLSHYTLYDIASIRDDALRGRLGMQANGFAPRRSGNHGFYRGGIRAQIFGLRRIWLSKIPLLFHDGTIEPLVHVHFSNRVVLAKVSTVLLHYKLTHALVPQTRDALLHEQYFNRSAEYRRYWRVLSRDATPHLALATAKTFQSVDRLVEEGFLVDNKGPEHPSG